MIKSITLKNFRNYSNIQLNLEEKFNFFLGLNGQGKSNFLEAIYMLSYIKSFRKVIDSEIAAYNEKNYYIKANLLNESSQLIEIGYESNKGKLVKLEGKSIETIIKAIGQINVVLFSDTDIELLYGGPVVRRSFLDRTLSLIDEEYLFSLYHYKKILKMRNASIKNYNDKKSDKDSVFAWNNGLIKYGSYIIEKRINFINDVSELCKNIYPAFTEHKFEMILNYKPSINILNDIKQDFAKSLEANFKNEISKNTTLFGPHRDEIEIRDKKFLLKKYVSKGQSRSACLILKLAQMNYIEEKKNKPCILILDDVLLDLDLKNKINFLSILGNNRQCFLSATNEQEFSGIKGKIFNVKNGKILHD